MILIIDFGSQYTHYIGRRLREIGAEFLISEPEEAMDIIDNQHPNGIILSGGPKSVYALDAPSIDKRLFSIDVPILGVCYGMMLMTHVLGGKVVGGRKEYGPAKLDLTKTTTPLTQGIPSSFTVWMSHGDEVVAIPPDFEIVGSTEHVPHALIKHTSKPLYGIQFHPEVQHTEYGIELYANFIDMCEVTLTTHHFNPDNIVSEIRDTVGDAYVIGAVSGGVDSTVAGVLTAQAIGNRFIPIYVDNGLMRPGTTEDVIEIFTKQGVAPRIVKADDEMLHKLVGVTDPEEKRKIIGAFYIEVFEREVKKLQKEGKRVTYLLQGTIYSDVIESKGTKHADKIKSHHNVGGLPEHFSLTLLEPLKDFYKDEVRQIGAMVGIPKEFVQKQKFPGPGYGIRIRGEVTPSRLEKAKQADVIVMEELTKAGWLDKVLHSFPVMTGADSTAVKGDGRFFGEVVALRITTSTDEMTCGWAELPYSVLQRISSRIVNEVPDVSRVVYDITTKPPATMEWE